MELEKEANKMAKKELALMSAPDNETFWRKVVKVPEVEEITSEQDDVTQPPKPVEPRLTPMLWTDFFEVL